MSKTTPCHVANLLEKMTSVDKDFRFMATNDLMGELQKASINLDDESEKKIVKMLLRLLEDKNGEVQNLAVKCLGPLVNRVKSLQVEFIVDSLCRNMSSDKGQLRDISSVALKTVIMELPRTSPDLLSVVCKKITGRLTAVVQESEDIVVQLESLDILAYLLSKFSVHLIIFHPMIRTALLALLQNSRLAVRKRAITAISFLCASCDQPTFNGIIETLLVCLSNESEDPSMIHTHIQCIAAISRQSGQRLGTNLAKIMPVVASFAHSSDDELKEYVMLAFESFLRKAPVEITPYLPDISAVCLQFLQYDPNYNYEDAEEEQMDTDGLETFETDDEYSDDDDMSWKVRRASAKCLEAIISTRHDMLVDLYKNVSPILIARYKEREENVKVDIFHAYISLLKQTKNCLSSSTSRPDSGDGEVMSLLQAQVPIIVRTLHKQLKERSVKTRQGCFNLLTELINVAPGCLREHIDMLMPGILYSLTDANSSSNMKVDTLVFINCLLRTHPPEVFYSSLNTLLPSVIAAVKETFYKITSEGLVVVNQLIKIIRPPENAVLPFKEYILPIYECILRNLMYADLDQEVKEKAITCLGQFISTFGDVLDSELATTLPILVDKLKNEITRLTSIKALINIANSQYRVDLSPYLSHALPILASFLRKNQRILKINTLILLNTLSRNYGSHITQSDVEAVLLEVPPLVNEADLHVSQLSLELLSSLVGSQLAHLPVVLNKILPETFELVRSPLLQGTALRALFGFYRSLIINEFPGLTFTSLVQHLTQPIYFPTASSSLHKQAYVSIAKCVASVSILDANVALQTVSSLMQDIVKHKDQETIQTFAFLAIGEIGKKVDLSSIESLKNLLVAALSSPSEDVKSSASFALGSVSVGNLQVYLPFLLSEIETRNKRQYLLLHSLKEIISCQSINQNMVHTLQPHLDAIWKLLLNHCQCPEEGTRNVVAECLGKLINLDPDTLLPRLQGFLQHESPLARATVVTAIKFTISEQPQPIDRLLKHSLASFLCTLTDEDINVRRVALVAFNSAAHNKPSLIRDLLEKILPQLYQETKVRPELIREVEMGPFKHSVDDGLDIRKAAFECMYTLLDSCLDRIDIFAFLDHVENGLNDHYDIKMLTYLMLIRLSHLCPSAVLNRADKLVDPLRVVCTSRLKSNAVKQENEKLDELKRSAMRAFMALCAIPDSDQITQMSEFTNQINNNAELKVLYEQIQKDNVSLSISKNTYSMDLN